jgi:hypothetical protein
MDMIGALVLGAAFGFFLERAGLGNCVKLAGQFYLRDFAVLKVMFTAIVTAMVGLYVLTAVGAVDPTHLRIPQTFLVPQILGGLVFGVGFVVGGYCPGTGCVALASGRLDGVAVLAGMAGGVYAFGELFDRMRDLYLATPLGAVTLPTVLGLPQIAVVALVTSLAGGAFVLAEWIERRPRVVAE